MEQILSTESAVIIFIFAGGIIFGGDPPPVIAEPFFCLVLAIGDTIVALAVPLLIRRNAGLVLTSPQTGSEGFDEADNRRQRTSGPSNKLSRLCLINHKV